ncbi:hypothetical protein FHR74_002119 [Sphingomonas aerolata]|nr:hypothetical protein [Sphingomonas aerolata]
MRHATIVRLAATCQWLIDQNVTTTLTASW